MSNSTQNMAGKRVMITGATDGIGLATAEQLANLGAEIVIVGRNPVKTAITVEYLQDITQNQQITSLNADLSSQDDIHKLVAEFTEDANRLDVLINNAGAMFPTWQESVDNIEKTFALNHLGYFLLTNLLIDSLKASSSARIINVASQMQTALNFDDLQNINNYHGWSVYAQSKFANVMFTYELARRLEKTNITVNALHPGVVRTKLFNGGKSPKEGAKTSVYLASSPQVESVSGQYFVDCKPAKTINATHKADDSARLWEISEHMTKLAITA